jgi:hypothetical protein
MKLISKTQSTNPDTFQPIVQVTIEIPFSIELLQDIKWNPELKQKFANDFLEEIITLIEEGRK